MLSWGNAKLGETRSWEKREVWRNAKLGEMQRRNAHPRLPAAPGTPRGCARPARAGAAGLSVALTAARKGNSVFLQNNSGGACKVACLALPVPHNGCVLYELLLHQLRLLERDLPRGGFFVNFLYS
jgi:hypothetical protein